MKTVGILGGMGSMATVDLFSKIIQYTKVSCDQDHLHIIVDNYSEIPDRTHYILHHENNPIEKMLEAAKRLEAAGADLIAMPCNTAHYFYDDLQSQIQIPIVHMMKETRTVLAKYKNPILFATQGTYASGLYEAVSEPSGQIKEDITTLIYDYKKGNDLNHSLKSSVLNALKHVDAIVLGCTELPLLFDSNVTTIDLIDPTTILAKSIITFAGATLKSLAVIDVDIPSPS